MKFRPSAAGAAATSSAIKRAALSSVLGMALLAGCSTSPPVHYYTLTGAELPDNASQGQAQTPTQATPAFMLEVLPVTVPPPADQPQLMMREQGGGLTPLYSERWSAPLADEVRGALADTLTRTLGAPDVAAIRAPAGAPVWRVTVDVQRLDSVTGREAIVDATWRVRPANLRGQAWQCRSISRVPVQGTDAESAVRGLRDATRDLALTIASAIQDGTGHPRPGSAQVQLMGCNQINE
ncbi:MULTISPECIES: membrane integrity-associated transporter subunit PqiC [unclassified Achromobacter]|uniref:PqiC family protein n=1 Tax=unclassified Achromobacter TaxID=2626865 RepID=UPI001E56A6F2|nr:MULTISPECIES: PqiC family protein [unclassified Achromobacter]